MKPLQKIANLFLVTTSLAVATLSTHAAVIADVRGDYVVGNFTTTTLPVADTYGTGNWGYYGSGSTNLSSKTALTWVAATSGHNAFYGTATDSNNIPAVAGTTSAFLDGAAPASNQIAWHPGGGTDADIEWTADTGETGLLTLNGDFSRLGENAIHSPGGGASPTNGGLVDFTIYVDGVPMYSMTGVGAGASDPFSFTFNSTVGTKVDLVLSADGNFAYDESLLSAQISTTNITATPEPGTRALALAGLGLVGMLVLRRKLRA